MEIEKKLKTIKSGDVDVEGCCPCQKGKAEALDEGEMECNDDSKV
jgi:hypothetical protein